MTLKDIALKNMLRRKAKTGFILVGLVIGVATFVAVITYSDAMTRDIGHKMEKFGANILIMPKTDNLPLSYGGMTLGGVSYDMQPIRQHDLPAIGTIKNAGNVAAVGPILLGRIQIGNQSALLAGIDFEAAGILKPWWHLSGSIPRKDQLLVGAETARVLNVGPGVEVNVNGQTLAVSGLLSPTGSQDDQLVFTPLETAQRVLNKPGQVSLVEVAALCNACPINEMVDQIAAKLPKANVMAIQQVVEGRMQTLAEFRRFSFGLSVVVMLVGGLVVLVTLMGSVKERTREIGIFRAIGFRKRDVMKIIFMETGLISLLAGMTGYILGIIMVLAGTHLFGIHVSAAIPFDPVLAAAAVATAMIVGLLASVHPAIMAARMDPNQALMAI